MLAVLAVTRHHDVRFIHTKKFSIENDAVFLRGENGHWYCSKLAHLQKVFVKDSQLSLPKIPLERWQSTRIEMTSLTCRYFLYRSRVCLRCLAVKPACNFKANIARHLYPEICIPRHD